jgi:hypothetical protein
MLAAFTDSITETQQKFSFRPPFSVKRMKMSNSFIRFIVKINLKSLVGSENVQYGEITCVAHFPSSLAML